MTIFRHAFRTDSAFEEYLKDPQHFIYAIGSVVGPHPFPKMVRDFQSVIGRESREQFLARHGHLPDHVTACVGGGSNAIGMFTAFLDDEFVHLVGVEPADECLDAFLTLSRVEGIIPALESAHAVAWAMRVAPTLPADQHILVNLSGRGDKDADYVAEKLGL